MEPGLERVLAQVNAERVAGVLVESLRRYSPSFAEHAATEFFARVLREGGVPFELQEVPNPVGGPARHNIIVRLGPQPPAVTWNGHVDTVPLQPHEELEVVREGDAVRGLGAADMKGGCAAVVEALRALVASGVELRRGLSVALVVGEEHEGDGSEALPNDVFGPLAIIGEPTGLVPCLEHRGFLEYHLCCRGRRAHASVPHAGASAIHAMLSWLSKLTEELPVGAAKDSVAFNLRAIEGGSGLFAVADRCGADVDFHLPASLERERIVALLEQTRARAASDHEGCALEAVEKFWAPGWREETGHPAVEGLRQAFAQVDEAFEEGVFWSHSDANLMLARGSLPVVCGPGRLEDAHAEHEYVSLQEVHRAARLYASIFWSACAA